MPDYFLDVAKNHGHTATWYLQQAGQKISQMSAHGGVLEVVFAGCLVIFIAGLILAGIRRAVGS